MKVWITAAIILLTLAGTAFGGEATPAEIVFYVH